VGEIPRVNILDLLRDAINEHGSATILGKHLELIKEQAAKLQKENEELAAKLAAKGKELAEATANLERYKAAEENAISDELIVDGILWSFTANRAKRGDQWERLLPLCPHCRMQLHFEFAPNMLSFTDSGVGVYVCDNEACGKFQRRFEGGRDSLEDRAMRHITAKFG